MILGTKNQINSIDFNTLPQIKIGNEIIPYVRSAKNLGVLLDDTLSWSLHVSQLVKRVWYTLRQIRHGRASLSCLSLSELSTELRKQLFLSLIVLIFYYCCLLFTNLTMADEKKLQIALNSCIRYIFGLRHDVSISLYYSWLGWLRLPARIKYFLCCLTYKLLNGKGPSYLVCLLRERMWLADLYVVATASWSSQCV